MSSARKRRAEITPSPPPPGTPKLTPAFPSSSSAAAAQRAGATAGSGSSSLMSLQQIINITDKRLTVLETMIAQGNVKGGSAPAAAAATAPAIAPAAIADAASKAAKEATAQIEVNVDELLHRFDVLAGEVAELKETLMKLQTYTIQVNHVLIQEKIKSGEIDGENIPELPECGGEEEAEADAEAEEVAAPAPAPAPAHPSRRSRASKNA